MKLAYAAVDRRAAAGMEEAAIDRLWAVDVDSSSRAEWATAAGGDSTAVGDAADSHSLVEAEDAWARQREYGPRLPWGVAA